MVAPLQRITTAPVIIQTGTAGDKNLKLFSALVEQAFNYLAPAGIFMNFVQYQKTRPGGEGFFDYFFPVRRRIPV